MTIQILSAKRIEGDDADKDTIPTTTLQQGTQFTAIDTKIQYIWNGIATWETFADPPSFWDREYFFDDLENWVIDQADYNISGGVFNYISNRPSAFAHSDILGVNFDNTAWIQRCQYVVDALTVVANPNIITAVGISSNITNGDGSKDYLGLGGYVVSTSMWMGVEQDNANIASGVVNEVGTNAMGLGTKYLQVIRQSSTLCDYTVWNDVNFSSLHASNIGAIIPATLVDLRFAWIGGRFSGATETNVLGGDIDNLQYADGTNTPP